MVISLEGLRKPESYREVILILGEGGILSEDFSGRFAPAGGFRNILVRRYAKVDVEKVYKFLQENLKHFKIFSKQIARHLERDT